MTDQAWAILIGAATVAALRIIDFFFPKGRWYNWGGKAVSDDDDDDDKDEAVPKPLSQRQIDELRPKRKGKDD